MGSSVNSNLCMACNRLMQGNADQIQELDYILYVHHRSVDDFLAAVQRSCPFCMSMANDYCGRKGISSVVSAYFWEIVPGLKRADTKPDFPFSTAELEKRDYGKETYLLRFQSVQVTPSVITAEPTILANFHLRPLSDEQKNASTSATSLTTGSDESMAKVLGWIRECSTNHPGCRKADKQSWYPTRLLRIDASGTLFRVIDTARDNPEGGYVTLSHCWGPTGGKRLTLNQDTRDELYQGMAIDSLPNTFKDAVVVCRAIGSLFLWIDSLCIVQDDSKDWDRESQLMHKVYNNGRLNISAAESRSSGEGLFRYRDPHTLGSPFVDVERQPTTADEFLPAGTYCFQDVNYRSANLDSTPLQSRAWVLQERILSPRNAHFGPLEIMWECNCLEASETFPTGLMMYSSDATGFKAFTSTMDQLQRARQTGSPTVSRDVASLQDELYLRWLRIRHTYMRQDLSFVKDRPVAIAGIARQYEASSGDEFFFGLWKSRLNEDLLWSAARRDETRQRRNPVDHCRDLPSFSWLSIEEGLEPWRVPPPGEISKFLYEVLDAHTHCENTECDRLSSVLPHIYLRGRLRQADIDYPSRVSWDGYSPGKLSVNGLLQIRSYVYLDRPWEFAQWGPRCKVFCLLTRQSDLAANGSRRRIFFTEGLLLQQAVEHGRGVFRRFGCFEISGVDPIEEFMRVDYRETASYPCVSYDHEACEHLICLV